MDSASRRQLARSLSTVENRSAGWREILAKSFAAGSKALIVGVTGPPGGGKSTLIDALAAHWSGLGHEVAIIAIDPASPFSGGAVLGDRVRMRRSEDLDSVFIRSMSARGHAGGLNEAALDLCTVLGGFGVARILLETVGVGQNEVEVAFVADCTLVLSVPGLGDSVQAAKAGLMEVGDVYVVNKGDLPGAGAVARDISNMLALVFAGSPGRNIGPADTFMLAAVPGPTRQRLGERYGDPSKPGGTWHPPVLTTIASDDKTVAAVIETIEACAGWMDESGQRDQRNLNRVGIHLRNILQRRLLERTLAGARPQLSFNGLVKAIAERRIDPYGAADRLLDAANPD